MSVFEILIHKNAYVMQFYKSFVFYNYGTITYDDYLKFVILSMFI